MHATDNLLQALACLAAAVVAVPVFGRLGLGAVLGYLAAGLAIGPWGLALIPDVESVLQVSELGVVLLLFLVGLELEPRRLWSLRRAIFGLGSLQVLATTGLAALALRAAGAGWPVAVALGMAAAMSSTAIALQILAERRLMTTPAGQSAFAVALFQDLAVIPMLLILAALAPHAEVPVTDAPSAWWRIGTAVVLVGGLILGGRLLLRPLLRVVAGTGMREVFIACALLVAIGSALLTQWAGLSMAMGAFIAGVLLADSEYRLELEVDIDPFKGLLLGLFFIATGMSIDLGLVMRDPLRVLALAAAAVGIKLGVLWTLARMFRLQRADGWIFALSLSQVGEFAFVLIGTATAGRLLAPGDAALANAVVALSMVSTPLLLLWYTRFVAPRLDAKGRGRPDPVDERNAVIVAGAGRMGQVVARLLIARGIPVTTIDHDPSQIELLRQFGWRTHYGDASRPDVLEKAGAGQARLLVLAIDDVAAIGRAVRHARKAWPGLRLLVRVRGRTDAYEMTDLGVPAVRETFGAAVEMGERALRALGEDADAARHAADTFRAHDEALLREAAIHRDDRERLIAVTLRARRDLARLLRDEAEDKAEDAVERAKAAAVGSSPAR